MSEETNEKSDELLAIVREALDKPLSEFYLKNVEISTEGLVENEEKKTPSGEVMTSEQWTLSLVKMLVMSVAKAREARKQKKP